MKSADPLGRITGTSVLSLEFRVAPGRDVYVGDLLVAEDEATGNRYLIRVTNVRYGLEGEPDLAPRVAGRMMQMSARGEDPRKGFWDADERLFHTAIGVPLGYVRSAVREDAAADGAAGRGGIKDGKFRRAKTLPGHFSPVRRANEADYEFLRAYMGDIEVGWLRSGETHVEFPVGIDGAKAIPYHIGVFATTGMGKSNLVRVLAASALVAARYGLLIIDPHGEYHSGGSDPRQKGLAHHPLAARNLSVYCARSVKGPHTKLTVSSHEVEVADLKQLFDFSGPQADFLDSARGHYKGAWLAEINDRADSQLIAEVPGKFFEGTVNVVKRKVARLFRTGLLHRDPKVSVSGPIVQELRAGKVVLVDSGGLSENEELLVATVLARAVFERNKAAFDEEGFEKIPPVLITIEEAQRVLGGGGEGSRKANVFAQIAREGRKFKTGLCAITQQPKLLDKEVISQFNTLFILGLADKRDRDILQDSAKQDVSQLENEIQMLMPGECLITSPYTPFAVPALVHLYEEYLERLAKDPRVDDALAAHASRKTAAPKQDFY
ncbi:MAG: ATP-binding protein [Thermoplasmatota archaeon]